MRKLDSETLARVEQTGIDLELDPMLVEKDAHVADAVRTLCLIARETPDIKPVFCGGTCLSQGYGLLDRMSEDVDFKLLLPSDMGRGAARKRLSDFKKRIRDGMAEEGFSLEGDIRARNENRYIVANFMYESDYPESFALRGSAIKVEFTVNDSLPEPYASRSLRRIIDRFAGPDDPAPDGTEVPVIGLAGTVSEKTVAFLRRSRAADRGRRGAMG